MMSDRGTVLSKDIEPVISLWTRLRNRLSHRRMDKNGFAKVFALIKSSMI